jgi:hypothetical protein
MSNTQGAESARRKSRIVINVAQAQADAQAQRRGRFGRPGRVSTIVALIVAGLVLLVFAGCYVWWRSYTRGPAYSLALLVDAARGDDIKAVESMIDADQIAQGFIPQVVEKLAGGAVALPPTIQRGQLSTAIPQLIPRMRETISSEIARSMKGVAAQKSESLPTSLLALGISRASEIEESGDAATVVFKSGDRSMEFLMRRDGERWKVVTVKDDVLAQEIAMRLSSSLPAPLAPQNQTRKRQ